jgi:DNA-binding transcriptional LysR family regulator
MTVWVGNRYPSGMQHLETRQLAYFVAVAEEQHIGRAADRLGMAQPPLSRAIQKLERQVGVPLLERAGRGIRLTAAGEVLMDEGRKVLDAAAAAGRRARRAGETQARLVLAMKPGSDSGLLPEILNAYREQPASAAVDVQVCGVGEQGPLVRTGAADLALMHLPYDDTSGFATELLKVEGRVAVLPTGHRLAGRTALCLHDLRDETLPRWYDQPGPGPRVRDAAQLMQLIALGQTIAVLPAAARAHLRHDLVAVPVDDAEPISVVLAWPQGSRSTALAGFIRAAAAVAVRRAATLPPTGQPAESTQPVAPGSFANLSSASASGGTDHAADIV